MNSRAVEDFKRCLKPGGLLVIRHNNFRLCDAPVGTAYPVPLAVTVTDAGHNPVPGAVVTFEAPASGPSGTFGGSGTTASAVTDAAGVAVAPAFTANFVAGGYVVVAVVSGVSPGASFALVNEVGASPPASSDVVGMAATPDGQGYWLVYANGVVATFGDAVNYGDPTGYVNGFNPAATIFPTLDSRGYWVASARGDVFAYGDSPYLGSMAAAGLNGEIIGAFGF